MSARQTLCSNRSWKKMRSTSDRSTRRARLNISTSLAKRVAAVVVVAAGGHEIIDDSIEHGAIESRVCCLWYASRSIRLSASAAAWQTAVVSKSSTESKNNLNCHSSGTY